MDVINGAVINIAVEVCLWNIDLDPFEYIVRSLKVKSGVGSEFYDQYSYLPLW